MGRSRSAVLRRRSLWLCTGLMVTTVTGCGATPAARIIDNCVLEPNSSCVQTNLAGADLRDLNLRGTDFSLSDARNAMLEGANFAGANLYLVNLTGAKVKGANFASANLIGAICPDGKVASGPTGKPPTCADLPVDYTLDGS